MARKRKGKGTKVKVNFKGIERRSLVDEGDFSIQPHKCEKQKADSGFDYLAWEFKVTDGDFKDSILYYNTSLQPQALWNLRDLLEAFDQEVPDGVMDLDLDELASLDETAMCTVEHQTHQGKKKSAIVDIFSSESEGENDNDNSDDNGEEEVEVSTMTEDELNEVVDTKDLDIDLDDYKSLKKKRAAVEEALEAAEDDNGDNGDDGDTTMYSEEEIMGMKKKALAGVMDDERLDVELTGKLRKDRKLVFKALEEEDQIGE